MSTIFVHDIPEATALRDELTSAISKLKSDIESTITKTELALVYTGDFIFYRDEFTNILKHLQKIDLTLTELIDLNMECIDINEGYMKSIEKVLNNIR